jgi:hypothetical protein
MTCQLAWGPKAKLTPWIQQRLTEHSLCARPWLGIFHMISFT